MAEQMQWLTPQAVNTALTPAPLSNNVLAGMQQGQQARFVNALSGLDVNDPDYLNKYATAAVRAGMDNTLKSIAEMRAGNFKRSVGQNAIRQDAPDLLQGVQSPNVGGDQSQNPNVGGQALAPTDQAPAPAPDPHAIAGLHSEIADQETALTHIPPGPERTAAAQQLAQHFAENRGMDPKAIAEVVANVNTPGYLENNIQQHHAAAAQALGSPAPNSQSPAVAPQVATDTGSQNPGTPAPGSNAEFDAARADLSDSAAKRRAILKEYAGLDYSEIPANARLKLAPQLAAEQTHQVAEATPFDAVYGAAAGPEFKGQTHHFASRAEFEADQKLHPGYWEAPSANQMSGTVELTRASDMSKVSFPNKAAAEAEVKAHPGVYGEPSAAQKALQGAAASTYTIPNPVTGGTDVTVGPPQGGAQGGSAATGLQPNVADADAAIRAAIPGATLTSGFRTDAQNKAAGGVSNSAHKAGEGLDYHIPPTITPTAMVAQIKQMYPTAKVLYEGPGAANSTGPHVHVAFPPPPSSTTTPGGTFSNQVGGSPGIARTSDMQEYVEKTQKVYSDPAFASNEQVAVNNGNMVKGLAPSAKGPWTPQFQAAANWAASLTGDKDMQKAATNVTDLAKVLATASRSALVGISNIRNQNEYNTLVNSIGNITDPKESLVYSGAAIAAAGQYKLAQQEAFKTYSQIPGHDPTQTAFNNYFATTAAGKKGIFGMPAWQGVDVNGKPLIDHKTFNGKKYIVVGSGLGKGNAQIIEE